MKTRYRGIYKRGDVYYITYCTTGRRIREAVGTNLRLAQEVLAKRRLDAREGVYFDVRKANVTVDEIAKDFLEYSKNNKASYQRDFYMTRNLLSFFGGMKIRDITPHLIEKYKAKRLVGHKPGTVNREIACLKCMFNWAIKGKKAVENPVRQVKMLRENNTRLRILSEDEIQRLINACPKCMRPIVVCALSTGMRRGEILALTWKNVNLEQGLIFIEHSKSGRRREIPINSVLKKTLEECRKSSDGVNVFCNEYRKPYRRIDTLFQTVVKRAGIQDFSFHDMRHTAASYLVMGGVDLVTVKEILGHQKIDMTLRYAHLSPGHKREAMEVLSGKLVTKWSQEGSEKGHLSKQLYSIRRRSTQVAEGAGLLNL